MYSKLPNLVIGFHGCKNEVFDAVIHNGQNLKASDNTYDWLGNGIYFWEHNLQRAEEWARRRYGDDAAVIGAVIDLGLCLNLTDSSSSEYLQWGYQLLQKQCKIYDRKMPENKPSNKSSDILLRDLDCAVIQTVQMAYNSKANQPTFDSVRGVFIEGEPMYPGSEIMEKTHVQLCICNPNCIKGYFKPRAENQNYSIP